MAQSVTVRIPHALGQQEARRRIEEGFGRMRTQMTGGMGAMLTFQERWDGNRLNFEASGLGQKMTGRLDVLADAVQIELDLPEFLAAIAGRISERLKSAGQKLLEKK
jgi:hypothetical protein